MHSQVLTVMPLEKMSSLLNWKLRWKADEMRSTILDVYLHQNNLSQDVFMFQRMALFKMSVRVVFEIFFTQTVEIKGLSKHN